ncbi:zinc-finger protein [Devosia limi DSM 17137]|uniref:Zinc-finger protein n=1 Tax=Devosia limi DSM 17137 TaxID=1121477 RepID=A0A0F5LND1_9HYPH|nr:DUF983 domain-containing protein [Devosia limi]KKB83805.1 zinc-finger protein [Devosia limi DSM 17137]SHE69195.1 Uncharacterized conserved protein, DUF983 family [Devosia limi DSM 17137]
MGVQVKTLQKRSVGQAMWRGTLCKCPQCGTGKMFTGYLKVADTCNNCGEELFHHRADDFPPYIAIMIVGHLLVAVMLHMEMVWHVNPLVYFYTMIPLAIILPLAILPSTKGSIVGLQWAQRMHGFDPAHRD